MTGRAVAGLAALALTLSIGAGDALALGSLSLDPATPGQGTTLLVAADESTLSSDGRPADSITYALARGMRVDTASVERLCAPDQAAHSACPAASRIGFGRFVVAVRGFVLGAGEADLSWSVDAFLGKPVVRGDAGSVVLTAKLLGADSVAALLAPVLGASIPATVTTVGRLVPQSSGPYGLELRFAKLPVNVGVKAPITAAPTDLELSLSAVRRVRQDFIRRFKIKTPTGYAIRKIHDHRLIGHYLLRTPAKCNGSWPSELRAGFGAATRRTASRIGCTSAG